jgi:hypothetical protein
MYHLTTKIKNAKNSSSAAVLAYRVCINLMDPRDGKMKYPHRSADDILTHFLVNWDNPGRSVGTRPIYQNIIDEIGRTETRINSRLFREFEIALPKEANDKNSEELVKSFALYLARKYNVVVIPAIHAAPDKKTGNRHAHVLVTTRMVQRDRGMVFLGEKNRLINAPTMLDDVRRFWEKVLNYFYEVMQIKKTVSCDSYEKQRIGKIPTIHEGAFHRRNKGHRWQTNQAIHSLNEIASQGANSPAEVWVNVENMRTDLGRQLEEKNHEIALLQNEIREGLEKTKLSSRQMDQAKRLKVIVVKAISEGGTTAEITENLKNRIVRDGEDKSAFFRLKKSLPPAGGDDELQRARDAVGLLALLFKDPSDETLEKLKKLAAGVTQMKPAKLADLSDPFFIEALREWEISIENPDKPEKMPDELEKKPEPEPSM